jgi:hypothetical protein
LAKPTPRQVAAIEKFGLTVPPTKSACSDLISYILQGNATVGGNQHKRIAIAKRYEEKYVGKKVRTRIPGKPNQQAEGTVRWLPARSLWSVQDSRESGTDHPYPFVAMVHFPSTKQTYPRPLSEIELLDDQPAENTVLG